MEYKLDLTETNDCSQLIKALDAQLTSIKQYSMFSSISFFMNDPIRRYDFLDGVHHLADQMYNFWRTNPDERAKAITRVHIKQAQYKKQINHKITVKEQERKTLMDTITKKDKEIDQLKKQLEDTKVESDPVDHLKRMNDDINENAKLIKFVEGQALNLRQMYESERVLRSRLSITYDELSQEFTSYRGEMEMELSNMNTHHHNLKTRLLNQVASLEIECKNEEQKIMTKDIRQNIKGTIIESHKTMMRDRFNYAADHKSVSSTYQSLFEKNDGDPMYIHNRDTYIASNMSDSDKELYDDSISGDDLFDMDDGMD